MSEAEATQQNHSEEEVDVKEQDRFLPIANVARIMKRALPQNAKIAKEAKETVQECVSEFISFVTSEASDRCQQEKRKTINGEDILYAMQSLGFENYVDVLKIYLSKYREVVKPERDVDSIKPDEGTQEGLNGMDVATERNNLQAQINAQNQFSTSGVQDPNVALYMNQAASAFYTHN
ncbi:Nuclear transcription factor Y subunit B-2 [Zancudomyces culisetae]|uniref:Nuclear transcription factor Y subunit B-2 n=1 Tax=Zancudomyces culisetae TaxID=1213189 RepID=A0A1R1PUP9_ZANCU|nr:Nuclear transcription factor Y subunit B-2 [Zancudomyces culisetae]|eukprot:OMH84708.1 Nuclear transcription factor Y subunit B-2 [Zancudomyces culisetae]